jgi:CBS domain-containing protein
MMVSVRDLMSPSPAEVTGDTTVAAALDLLLSRGVQELYVADREGNLAGVVTDYELFKAQMTRTVERQRVESVMSRSPACVSADEPVAAVAGMFREARYAQMAVIDRGHLVGVVGRRDVMRLVQSLDEAGLDLACSGDAGTLDAANAMRGPRYVQNRMLMAEQSPSV